MTAYTSSTAGDWGTGTNWTPNGVPTTGDTATIASGSNITASSSQAIGTSPAAGNVVLTVNSGATLTISGGTFTLKGDALLKGTGKITCSAGITFEFDASAASSPSSQKYQVAIGDTHNSTPGFTCNGSSGSHVTIKSNAGGGNGRFTDGSGPWLRGGLMNCTYTDFQSIGDSSNAAILTSPSGGSTVFSLANCTFDSACGRIDGTYNLGADVTYSIVDTSHQGTVGTDSLVVRTSASIGTGTRLINRSYFNLQASFFGGVDVSLTNCVLNVSSTLTPGVFAAISGNFFRVPTATSANYIFQGTVLNNYFFADDATANFHFLQFNATSTADGNIFDSRGNSNNADCILLGTPGSAQTFTIIRNIVLPNNGGECTGTIVSALGNANCTFSVTHNTYFAGSQGCAIGETYNGHSGMLSAFKDNIAWDNSARGYKLYDVPPNNTVSDYVTSGNANYNCGYNLLAGSNLKGYNDLEFSSGSPGANDIDVNPTFVAATRNLATYDASVGGPGTYANAVTELQKMGLSTFNSAYTPSTIVTWVKNGFKVQNIQLKDAGSDGTTIGAMAYQAPAGFKGGCCLLGAGN